MYETTTKCYYRGYVVDCTVAKEEYRGYRATLEISRGDSENPSRIREAPLRVLFKDRQSATYCALQWAERRIDNLSETEHLRMCGRAGSPARDHRQG